MNNTNTRVTYNQDLLPPWPGHIARAARTAQHRDTPFIQAALRLVLLCGRAKMVSMEALQIMQMVTTPARRKATLPRTPTHGCGRAPVKPDPQDRRHTRFGPWAAGRSLLPAVVTHNIRKWKRETAETRRFSINSHFLEYSSINTSGNVSVHSFLYF